MKLSDKISPNWTEGERLLFARAVADSLCPVPPAKIVYQLSESLRHVAVRPAHWLELNREMIFEPLAKDI